MKKFFYQYFCLLYSIAQSFFFFTFLIQGCIERFDPEISYVPVAEIIISFLCMYGSAMIECLIRKVKLTNFWLDSLLLFFLTPIRFIFQIITIVRLHLNYKNGGDEKFGQRGVLTRCYENGYYLVFNSGHYLSKTSAGKPVKKTKKQLQREQAEREVFGKRDDELQNGINFLYQYFRGDGRFNVNIVPLSAVNDPISDYNDLGTFSHTNAVKGSDLYITEIRVNGILLLDIMTSNAVSLSLRPGHYDFMVKVEGGIRSKSAMVTNSEQKISKTFELRNVEVGNNDVFLCVAMQFTMCYDEYYRGSTVVEQRCTSWKKNYQFVNVSRYDLESTCNFWNAYQFSIKEHPETNWYLVRNKSKR